METVRYWFTVLHEASTASYETFKDTTGFSILLVLWVVFGLLSALIRKGPKEFRVEAKDLLDGVLPLVLACACLVIWHMAKIPASRYAAQLARAEAAELRSQRIEEQLHVRRHYPDNTEPSFANARTVTLAFVEWRKSLGSEPATLLITGDKEAGRFMGAFGQFAVDGTNIGNISRAPVQLGNLQNIGIKPENTQDLENAASKEGTLMVFAVADTHHPDRVMKLTDALASLVLRVERSYKMPPTPMPLPPNVVWLHFGKGVRWSSEYWEEQAARKQPSQ